MGTTSSKRRSEGHKNNDSIVLCSVCIATYRRAELLDTLLQSIENQELDENTDLEIIVVDNDPDASAEKVVEPYLTNGRFHYRYLKQPEKNISLTRNMAVNNATGDYLAFIDDDERADRKWIACLILAVRKFNADGVIGKVVPEFNSETPRWMRRRILFYPLPGEAGQIASFTRTSNCLIKASLIKYLDGPFDPKYGITGGEDTHFFGKLEKNGARFVNYPDAIVYEYLPPSRTRVSYLYRRGLRSGNVHTRRVLEFAKPGHRFFIRIFMLAKALCYGSISLGAMAVCFPSAYHRTRWLLKLASNIGRFLAVFGWHYRLYK